MSDFAPLPVLPLRSSHPPLSAAAPPSPPTSSPNTTIPSQPPPSPVGTDASLHEMVRRAVSFSTPFSRRIAALGSTGSIGTQTLDLPREVPHIFSVTSLTAANNVDVLAAQAAEFNRVYFE